MSIFHPKEKKEVFNALFTLSEKDWLKKQAEEECCSQNAIVRKSVKQYKESLIKKPN